MDRQAMRGAFERALDEIEMHSAGSPSSFRFDIEVTFSTGVVVKCSPVGAWAAPAPTLDPAISALFRWRTARSDRYGDDLASLLLSEFGTDPYITHYDRSVSPEHEPALAAFRALSHAQQERFVTLWVEADNA
jgi:hypothetical protein